MPRDPLEAIAILDAWMVRCGRCPEDVERALESVREAVRARLREPEDPLDDAADALAHAETAAFKYAGPHGEAIAWEVRQAAASVARAIALRART